MLLDILRKSLGDRISPYLVNFKLLLATKFVVLICLKFFEPLTREHSRRSNTASLIHAFFS